MKKGFTIIELLLVLIIGIIITAFGLRITSRTAGTEHVSRKLNELHLVKNNVFNEFTQEIHWATAIKATAGKLDLDKGPDKVMYIVENNGLYRFEPPEKTRLTTDDVLVDSFEVRNLAPNDAPALIEIKITLKHANEVPTVVDMSAETIISQRKQI